MNQTEANVKLGSSRHHLYPNCDGINLFQLLVSHFETSPKWKRERQKSQRYLHSLNYDSNQLMLMFQMILPGEKKNSSDYTELDNNLWNLHVACLWQITQPHFNTTPSPTTRCDISLWTPNFVGFYFVWYSTVCY